MSVFFCTATGVRIVAPGVSTAVDPKNGVEEYVEPEAKKPEGNKPPKNSQNPVTTVVPPVAVLSNAGADSGKPNDSDKPGDQKPGDPAKS